MVKLKLIQECKKLRYSTLKGQNFQVRLLLMSKFLISIILFFSSINLWAQFRFQPKFDVPVTKNGSALARAWEGGLNAAQFQTMDLNNDDVLDLIIYHRISRDITSYLNIQGDYVRSPQFDDVFPEDTRSLLLLKDFDCDGKKDLFTTTTLGIKVYRNTSTDEAISWSTAKEFLTFDGGSNIQMAPSDIPGIADINGDGALDIITFRFGNANAVDLYLNTSACGSLEFTRAERGWGQFEECGCNDFVFGEECPTSGAAISEDKFVPQSVQHIGGKTLMLFDADNDGDMDLITSDETCETLYFMENEGDRENALMTRIQPFPINEPAGFPFFPSAFLEDIDQDGLEDLLIATNADENLGSQIELSKHVKVYTNEGTNGIFEFNASSPFFQHEMIDIGEHVYPAFFDIEGDGDQDLILGNKGLIETTGLSATLQVFENIGNPISPQFEFREDDYLGLLDEQLTFIKPQFIDFDNDGDQDLIYQATVSFGDTRFFYRENTGNQEFAAAIELNLNSSTNDNPFWYDIDNDNDLDLLLGKQFGSLSLFINEGNFNFEAEQNGFAGIIDDFQRLNLNILITDIDDNGIDDLLTTDLTGQLRAFRGPIDLDFLATNPIAEIYYRDDVPGVSAFGIQNAMAATDLLGTRKPSLLLGNIKGGISFLENISENNGRTDEVIIRVRPNPAQTDLKVLTNINGVLEVINVSGQKFLQNIPIVPGIELDLDIAALPAGLYIFRVISEQGQTQSTKVIIN